jgi:hypothetical protein
MSAGSATAAPSMLVTTPDGVFRVRLLRDGDERSDGLTKFGADEIEFCTEQGRPVVAFMRRFVEDIIGAGRVLHLGYKGSVPKSNVAEIAAWLVVSK